MRNIENHVQQLRQIHEATSKKEKDLLKSKFGINGVASAIMNVPYIGDQFPHIIQPDVMHDCLHGVAEYCLLSFFKFCHSKNNAKKFKFTASQLNNAIEQFCKSADAREKYIGLPIASFRDDFTVNLSASQMRVLLSRISVIMSFVKPQLPPSFYNSPEWRVVINLSRIVSFLLSPVLLDDDVDLLENLILKFLESYSSRYGSDEFKNKFHHLIHYPNNIRKYGPSRYACTMPYERSLSKISKAIHSKKTLFNKLQIA